MYSEALQKRLDTLWESGLPFVVYRLPESQEIVIYYQKDNQLNITHNFSDSGFVMASFANSDNHPFIPNSKTELFQKPNPQIFDTKPIFFSENYETKKQFINLVKLAKEEIAQRTLQKVVISRTIDFDSAKNPQALFLALENIYPNTLAYLWHHPLVGTWLGATPEKFIETSSMQTQTMALAGTQVYNPNKVPKWSRKEIEEQALVTQQVLFDLKTLFKDDEIHYSEPISKRAGNLVHICTHFTLPKLNTSLEKLVTTLHPTPAVGGVPKSEAKKFILNNESHDRLFYSGFLGSITTKKTNLFVNLRCAEWNAGQLRLYVGAGITLSSDPESEWLETQRKAETLARIL
tara:strand:- start:182 stop:1225 length:1044 start_codon:yes stop_codon:yes gene_type:complete